MNGAGDPMFLFTSILKDIVEETIPDTSAVPKRLYNPWFSDIFNDAIRERNMAHEREQTEETSIPIALLRQRLAKIFDTVKNILENRIRKIKGKKSSNTIHHLFVNDRDITSFRDIANGLVDNVYRNSSYAFSTYMDSLLYVKS